MTDAPFTGALAGFADTLRWVEDEPGERAGAATLRPHLLCYQHSVGGPWRAACSLWGQVYFNTLLIPATCWLAKGWRDDVFVCRLAPRFCPKAGAPKCFALCCERRSGRSAELAFVRLLEAHLQGVIDELAQEGGLSKRMLWESATRSLRWAAAELSACPSACVSRLKGVVERAGAGSRLASAWREGGEQGHAGVRKSCCLRYQLSGGAMCANICPRDKS